MAAKKEETTFCSAPHVAKGIEIDYVTAAAVWRPIKGGKLQLRHVLASRVGKWQFIFTAEAPAYFTTFAGSLEMIT